RSPKATSLVTGGSGHEATRLSRNACSSLQSTSRAEIHWRYSGSEHTTTVINGKRMRNPLISFPEKPKMSRMILRRPFIGERVFYKLLLPGNLYRRSGIKSGKSYFLPVPYLKRF